MRHGNWRSILAWHTMPPEGARIRMTNDIDVLNEIGIPIDAAGVTGTIDQVRDNDIGIMVHLRMFDHNRQRPSNFLWYVPGENWERYMELVYD